MKAVGLLSGGLDSILAVKLIQEQGVEVVGLNFTSTFYTKVQKSKTHASKYAKEFKIPLKVIDAGYDYLKILRKPKHGYGKAMNPCIDCKIFMLKKAKRYAKRIGAKFIFTGEVLGERPMSQHRGALNIIEREAGLKGKLLRPLSAKLLPETEAEKKSWVDRNKLLAIQGRSRKPQMALAEKYKIKDYPWPAGGCLLTSKEFANKLRDLFKHKKRVRLKDIELLKLGRHFRQGKNKLIVGRNEEENNQIIKLRPRTELIFEVKDHMGPTTLLRGKPSKKAIELAASLTATYSDAKQDKVLVVYGKKKLSKEITVKQMSREEAEKIRI